MPFIDDGRTNAGRDKNEPLAGLGDDLLQDPVIDAGERAVHFIRPRCSLLPIGVFESERAGVLGDRAFGLVLGAVAAGEREHLVESQPRFRAAEKMFGRQAHQTQSSVIGDIGVGGEDVDALKERGARGKFPQRLRKFGRSISLA